MKVLLIDNVPNVGKSGEVKEVADGFARNFLIPRGLASSATTSSLKRAAELKAVEGKRAARQEQDLKTLAGQIEQTPIVFKAKVGEQHRLYGSITSADIADELTRKLGHEVDKRRVELDDPIRHLGEFKVSVRLGAKIVPQATVVVEAEAGS